MLKIFKRKKETHEAKVSPDFDHSEAKKSAGDLPEEESKKESGKIGFFRRLKNGLSKTRNNLGNGLANLILGKKTIDADLFEEIETQLLLADVGVDTTKKIIQALTDRVSRKELTDTDALYQALQSLLLEILQPVNKPLIIDAESVKPYVILVIGVNGSGKTTTIGKLAKKLQNQGKSVMLAAGDTFRAAAVEQLQIWGERNNTPVIAQHTGADSASVVYDAFSAAQARNIDVLIADTAGRLHTQNDLMNELSKVKRVLGKIDAKAPHEILLVLDSSVGQNALLQAKSFNQALQVTGIALTKLDGTAKGGIIFAIANEFALPVRYIGLGEGIEDLRDFDAETFINVLFTQEANSDHAETQQ